jgi:hypothetical protein
MSDEAELRPFRVHMPEAAIADLPRRRTGVHGPGRNPYVGVAGVAPAI